jgi:integrase
MAVRWNRGAYEVKAYDPKVKRLVYVGRRKKEGDAKKLFRQKTDEFQSERPSTLTMRQYAEQWLEDHHGPGTNRPAKTTRQVNEGNLRQFLAEFGDRPVDGGIGRKEALKWSKPRPHVAKTVSAMLNDAIDDEDARGNPFANRKHKRSSERRLIAPITQAELDTLARIAEVHWGEDGYGQVAKAWVLFAAWVGCRPGETFSVPMRNVDWHRGLVTIRRVKPPYDEDIPVIPTAALDQLKAVRHLLAQEGPMFRTVTGRPMVKGSLSYHWSPIRAAFRQKVTEERWNALIDYDEGGKRKDLHLYVLRHRVASVMADRGATAREIAEQLGNTPEVCERIYIHPFTSDVRERNRKLLDDASVVDLQAVRERNGA